jgi:hypothetical protein
MNIPTEHPATAYAIKCSLFFRHSGHPHALTDALAPGTEGRIVTHSASDAANGESWMECKPRRIASRASSNEPSNASAAARWKCARG